jgi:hypothetical protein
VLPSGCRQVRVCRDGGREGREGGWGGGGRSDNLMCHPSDPNPHLPTPYPP